MQDTLRVFLASRTVTIAGHVQVPQRRADKVEAERVEEVENASEAD